MDYSDNQMNLADSLEIPLLSAILRQEVILMPSKKRTKHRKTHSGRPSGRSKWDIFNGNVSNPGEFLFIYSLIGAMCAAVIILFVIQSAPKSPEDLLHAQVCFDRYEMDGEQLLLYSDSSEKYYVIPAYTQLLSAPEAFLRLCDGGASFRVGYEDYVKADTPYFGLESITGSDGTVYLTMEAVREYRLQDAWAFYLLFGGITLLWFLIVGLSIYVGRNPQKFSPRFIRLFFNDGYVRR